VKPVEQFEFDLVVVGAGTAGMAAAIEASANGSSVLLVEKTGRVGGTLLLTDAGMSAANSKRQISQGIEDSTESHYRDVMRIGRYKASSELLRLAVENAAATVDWLEELGAEPRPLKVDGIWGKGKMVGGVLHEPYSVPRLHFWADGGPAVVRAMEKALARAIGREDVTVLFGATVVGFMQDQRARVTGVELHDSSGERTSAAAAAVILATGGYGANPKLIAELHPQCVPVLSLSADHATGDGVALARSVGAAIVNTDTFVSYPGMLEDPVNPGRPAASQLFRPATRSAAIWVNALGKRFINEDEESTDVREHTLLEQPGCAWWVLWDERMHRERRPDVNPWEAQDWDREIERGVMVRHADSLVALAGLCEIDADGLSEAVASYNEQVAAVEDEFGRTDLLPILEPPFYAFKTLGNVLSTRAGIKVNVALQAEHQDGRAIEGLYVVGEALGNGQLMGDGVASGMNIGPAISFGRLAGRRAAEDARRRRSESPREQATSL
jgi:fumarate reductase flavoprotein subunit